MQKTVPNAFLVTLALSGAALAQQQQVFTSTSLTLGPSSEPPMVRGDMPAASQGWTVAPIFTVSESIGSYTPTGILDGVGAFPKSNGRPALVLVNSELGQNAGYPYTLGNGTRMTGARVSYLKIARTPAGQITIHGAGLAYERAYDRFFYPVTDPAQINETGNAIDGLARLCSSQAISELEYGFVDNLYITGEETSTPGHPHGGSQWVIDVDSRTIWAVPGLGRGSWENVTPLDTGDPSTIALVMGDDLEGAPLYLYVGQKNALGDGSFLDRNGFRVGSLYAWKADNGDLTPQDFNGQDSHRSGTFVQVQVQDVAKAGTPGYDVQGYLDDTTLRSQADALGCFSFSRPEDVATNPLDGTQVVLASTGRGQLYPADNWGMLFVIDVDFSNLSADIVILHDANGLPVPDEGIRSPDNLDWADDGKIYVQEDRSTSPASLFGAVTGIEASIWQLDPITRGTRRIAEIDRSAVAPAGSTDSGAGDLGNWETSGILDVTGVFGVAPGERLFLATVQAHGIRDGLIGGSTYLVEGGQLVFVSKVGQ